MKILRRLLLMCALLCAGFICTGCDDEDQGTIPSLARVWMPVPGGFSSTTGSSGSAGGSGTP